MDLILNVKDPISCKASWVLEFAIKQKVSLLFPIMDRFTKGLHTLELESSIRPNAKICEILVTNYFSKQDNAVKSTLKSYHLEEITAACFDWLIGNHKVASQAYSMTSLFLLGKKYDWIHPELRIVLEQNYQSGTAAYKARARMILSKLIP